MEHRVELRVVDDAIPEYPRHHWVDEAYDLLGVLDATAHPVHGGAKSAVAMTVGWGHVHEGHIGLQDLPHEKQRELTKVYWDSLRIARCNLLAEVAAHERRDRRNVLCSPLVSGGLGSWAFHVHMGGAYVRQVPLLPHVDHAIEKDLRRSCTSMDQGEAIRRQEWCNGLLGGGAYFGFMVTPR